jgi:hypothetical protein
MSAQDSGTGRRKDPFRAALPPGTVGGIQIRVDLSTAVIFALIAFGLAAWQFPAVNPHRATLTYALAAVVTTVGFFASLLAHELAHSLVARHYGLTVNSITLWLFGVVFVGLALLAGTGRPARASIPGVIWWRTGDRVKATVWASRAGQVFGTICIVGGLYLFFLTRDWSWLWISLIGWFLTGAATAEAQQAVLAGRLRGIRASQIMTPDPVTVPGSMTVSEFIDDYLFRARHQSFPVTRDGPGQHLTTLQS